MQKPLENVYMEIVVHRDFILDGARFHPGENLLAQATEKSREKWHISRALDSVCVADWSQLEKWKKEGLISYE